MASFYLDPQTGKRYYERRAFSYGDANYTKAGAVEATFLGLGFQKVDIQARPNSKFYFVSSVADDGTYNATPRPLDDLPQVDENGDPVLDENGAQYVSPGLKTVFKAKQKEVANSLLAPTDWMVVRAVEDPSKPVDAAVATYRSDVRTASGAREAEIDAATTVAELETLITATALVYNEETEEFDVNPAAMTQWPEAL